ncbi:TPA: hypothetical protein EYN98_31325 [Candidatus Poribacteria bacterium]|nr:hypothetical protein [Candidatus Poribacteria bacterium]
MRFNCRFLLVTLALFVGAGMFSVSMAGDFAVYSGPTNPGWISDGAVEAIVNTVTKHAGVKAMFDNIDNYGDGDEVGDKSPLANWLKDHTGNGQTDVVLTACGTCPSSFYPFPNKEPDGSNIEEFIEAGNVHINVADWIYYMSYEGGVRSADNGGTGAANIFDIPGLSFGNRGSNFEPTAEGKKYIPSLKPYDSTRPWHLEQFKGTPWDLVVFAVDSGDKNSADPVVAISTEEGKDGKGMIAAMWQKDAPVWAGKPDPRGIGVAEFMVNWLQEKASFAVNPKEKMSTTWGYVKARRK